MSLDAPWYTLGGVTNTASSVAAKVGFGGAGEASEAQMDEVNEAFSVTFFTCVDVREAEMIGFTICRCGTICQRWLLYDARLRRSVKATPLS